MQLAIQEKSQICANVAVWEIPHMAKKDIQPGVSGRLDALLRSAKPPELSERAWLIQSKVNTSFFTDLRAGKEPGIDKIERLARRAGMSLAELLEGAPTEAEAPDTIVVSLANLAVFVRRVLNGGQEGPYSQGDALEIAHELRSAIEVARSKPGTLDDPAEWATFLHGYAAGKPFGLPRS